MGHDYMPWIVGSVLVGLLALCITAGIHADHQWQQFASAHECKVVGRMAGDMLVSPVFSSKGGVAVTMVPAKTAFLCNDGVTYWRDN